MAADLTHAALLYRTGPPRNFPIPHGDATIGYANLNTVPIPIEGVSRRHAKISFDGKDYWIEDAGSVNGTFLNGSRVTRRERLRHLDIVTLGRRTDLIFVRRAAEFPRAARHGIKSAWLEVVDGPEAGMRREIPRGSFTIGRAPSNNITVESQVVSKVHARIERTGVQLLLADLQSANGTFVEGKKIESVVLKDGDEINLGKVRTYRVRIEEGEVITRDVALPRPPDPSPSGTLPTDWKTRIEWTPEEKAAFDQAIRPGHGVALASAVTFRQIPKEPSKTAAAPKQQYERAEAPKPSASAAPSRQEIARSPQREPPASVQAPQAPVIKAKPPAAPEPALSPDATRPISAMAAHTPRVILEGKIQKFSLQIGDHEVGRVPTCAIQLEGPQISRHHAVIRVRVDQVIVEDLGSANGTFVNGERVTAPRILMHTDRLAFGNIAFGVALLTAPEAPPKNGEKRP